MGASPQELARLYPRLYHMAEMDSWDSICRHGLLSTSALLSLFAVEGEARRRVEACRRESPEVIRHQTLGHVVIRSQKPIIETKLEAALEGCTLEEWYRVLNSRVFFWLTEERLLTLLSAREYRGKPHTVLTLETLALVIDYQDSVTLSSMNSGNTLPIAHPRGIATFKRLNEYPFRERLKRGSYYAVVELAVEGGVKNIRDYTLSVDLMMSDREKLTNIRKVFAR
jgi:hypothetical protein